MKIRPLLLRSALLVTAAFAPFFSRAALPDAVPYQGRVAVEGVSFTGTGQFRFAIYEHTNGDFATARAQASITNGFVTSVVVTDGGSGYSNAVTVSFDGGGGSGATATVTVVRGVITAITLTDAGTGYTSAPKVGITDPAAPTQLWNNAVGATSAALGQPSSAVSLPVVNGLYAAGLGDTALTNMAALPASLAPAVGKRAFVRVWLNDGTHGTQLLSPDTELRAVPFARQASTALNATNLGGVAPANFARLDTANTFAHVDGIAVTGTGPSNGNPATGATVPLSGAGTRMEFLPGYGAFRAGTVEGTQWDAASIGVYSIALGWSTTASGGCSTALGAFTTASGFGSIASGDSTIASASCSTALGYSTTASGDSSTALGSSTTANGTNSTALGKNSTASGYGSTAFGSYTTALGNYSTALGYGTIASGNGSTALGNTTTAESYCETVIGRFNTNYTPSSTNEWNSADRLFVVGNGTTSAARSDALIVYKNGNATLKGTLTQGSDRNRKTDIVPADTAAILSAVAALPVSTWKYKDETTTHLGPMAQDFAAAFRLGADETGIASVDADGVALAAIQELNKRVAALAEQNAAKDARIDALEARLAAIEAKLAQ